MLFECSRRKYGNQCNWVGPESDLLDYTAHVLCLAWDGEEELTKDGTAKPRSCLKKVVEQVPGIGCPMCACAAVKSELDDVPPPAPVQSLEELTAMVLDLRARVAALEKQ